MIYCASEEKISERYVKCARIILIRHEVRGNAESLSWFLQIYGRFTSANFKPLLKMPVTIGTVPLYSTYRCVHFEDSTENNHIGKWKSLFVAHFIQLKLKFSSFFFFNLHVRFWLQYHSNTKLRWKIWRNCHSLHHCIQFIECGKIKSVEKHRKMIPKHRYKILRRGMMQIHQNIEILLFVSIKGHRFKCSVLDICRTS